MLTVKFDGPLRVSRGDRVLDVGCGGGRHAFEFYRRGAHVVALDRNAEDLAEVAAMFRAMALAGEAPESATAATVEGDALHLPFGDATFDIVLAAEILEHIPDDEAAMGEIFRVVRPGGTVAVTVPRWLPERVCWALSDEYHAVEGGHVRIYSRSELVGKLEHAGLSLTAAHHAHALHSPYWWLKCAVGVGRDDAVLARHYHRLLVWDLMRRPWLTRTAERILDPLIGKSLVVYLRKAEEVQGVAA
ncbi:MAG: methyltransferase domain-containing protein [Nitriliruptorales bacterium]|nr:methyltransferase domain-containing protein [Nitriliruptorales bacterium]